VRVTNVFKAGVGLVNVFSYNRPRDYRVRPSDPDASLLVRKITTAEADAEIGAPMPYSFPSLNDVQRDTLQQWIQEGAQNN
jgi:hypothetical protein